MPATRSCVGSLPRRAHLRLNSGGSETSWSSSSRGRRISSAAPTARSRRSSAGIARVSTTLFGEKRRCRRLAAVDRRPDRRHHHSGGSPLEVRSPMPGACACSAPCTTRRLTVHARRRGGAWRTDARGEHRLGSDTSLRRGCGRTTTGIRSGYVAIRDGLMAGASYRTSCRGAAAGARRRRAARRFIERELSAWDDGRVFFSSYAASGTWVDGESAGRRHRAESPTSHGDHRP